MLDANEFLLLRYLARYVSEHKKQLIESVLAARTRHLTVVLEDIYQSQNLSAVIRTCECFGIQDLHIIENTRSYAVNKRVLKGAHKWMTLVRYRQGEDRTLECFRALRQNNYRIVVASPDGSGIPIDELDVSSRVALVFGNELHGLSHQAREYCDQQVKIPMYGFTESFNISVSAALCVSAAINKIRTGPHDFHLTGPERDELRLMWYRKIIRRSEIIEREYLRTIA